MGYGLPPEETSSLFHTLSLSQHITHINADVRDLNLLKDAITRYNPEFVFHLAAQSLVRRSYQDPLNTFSTNVLGTINILETVRQHGSTRVLINVTTDKVYLDREWNYAYRENDPLGGYDPYSASKACADLLTSVYQHVEFTGRQMGVATVRAGNVYGGGDWSRDRLVPDIVRAYQRHVPVEIRNPKAVRPWQYVLEPLSGYLHLASRLYNDPDFYAGAWNFGPEVGNTLSVSEFVERFLMYFPRTRVLLQDGTQGPLETKLLRLDWTKSSSMLGWSPSLSLDEGLQHTVSWYLSDLDRTTNLHLGIEYIADYTRIASTRSAVWAT